MGTRAILFASDIGDVPANMAFINNYSATVDPGVGNDRTQGYRRGSQWLNRSNGFVWYCIDDTLGAAVWVVISSDTTTPGQVAAPAASTPTGNGSDAKLTGGAGGSTSGNGGKSELIGGAATAGNGNGGSVIIQGGAKNGTGVAGMAIARSVQLGPQGAPAAKTVSATLTAAEVLSGIITVNQGAAGASAQQLPLATAMDTAFPDAAAGDSFDFSVINISTVDAEDASVTTNTGWTLVGSMDVPAYSAAGSLNSSGRFRARKTGTGAWTLYRLS